MLAKDVSSHFSELYFICAAVITHLFTFWQCRYSMMLELKSDVNFKDDAAYCACSDNQEGSSVFHNLRTLNGEVV